MLINKLGYSIENKANRKKEMEKPLKKFRNLQNFNLLILAKNYVLNLDNKFENLRIENHKEGFLVSFLDVSIYVESLEEFHILNEVFVNNDYNFITNEKSILIDIGANIGITSLFFSMCNYIDKIYAFEPVKDTFEQAKYNFNLNDEICKVERIKNIGLGENDRKETFLFDKNTKGNTGVRGELSPSYSNNPNALERSVQICNASLEIEKILSKTKDKNVIVKMDCEGAEYEIIENLYESNIINQIDVILLEWHDKGSESIEAILTKVGFDIFSLSLGPITGVIYAKKCKS
jgi:FkbM family methyltransferase